MPPKKKITPDPAIDEQDNEQDDEGQYYTAEDTNKAIGARLQAFKKAFMKDIESMFAPIVAKLDEIKAAPAAAPEDKPGDKQVVDKQVEGRIAALQKQLDAANAAQKAADEEREAEKEKARAAQRESMVTSALAKIGISNPTVAKAAAGLLMPAVAHAEDGRVIYKRMNKFGIEDELDVEQAVNDWAKTDDGKAFIPAKKVAGTGSRPEARSFLPSSGGKPDPRADKAAKKEAAREFLKTAFAPITGGE